MSACGVVGAKPFVVDIPSGAPHTQRGPITVHSVDLEPGHFTVGTASWLQFDKDDAGVLKESMKESAAQITGPNPFGVHVVIRSFLVSRKPMVGLACVAWAVTKPDGTLVYSEQFYTSQKPSLLDSVTIGGIKDIVNEALARRVLGRASAIASAPDSLSSVEGEVPAPLRQKFTRTFDTYEDAIRDLKPEDYFKYVRASDTIDWQARFAAMSR